MLSEMSTVQMIVIAAVVLLLGIVAVFEKNPPEAGR